MKDWIKYSIDTPIRITGNSNNHNVATGSVITIKGLSDFPYLESAGFSYRRKEGGHSFRSCDIEPVNPDDYYKYLKKGDYVVCIENTSGLDWRKINTVYQITRDSAFQSCVYFGKNLNSSKVKEFRLATFSEIEKCKANNNEPTSLDEKVEEIPYRWFVRATVENRDILKKWREGSYVTWKDDLCVTFEKMWNSVEGVIKDHTEISFEQFCKKFGIENNLTSPTINPSTLVKEIVIKEDWKHGWYKIDIDDSYLHYSGDTKNCYGFWAHSWGSGYIMEFSWTYKFIDTPDETLSKLFFEKAAKYYPEGTRFFPVNKAAPEWESKADGYIKKEIKWWENQCYKKGEALTSRSGSGIFYYNGVWANIYQMKNLIDVRLPLLDTFYSVFKPKKSTQKSPTIADKTNIKIGTRVVRGRDWSWEDQDGGEGNIGVVIEEEEYYPKNPTYPWVKVQWGENGEAEAYKIGYNNRYDLYLAPDEVSSQQNPQGKPRKMYKIGIDPAIETKEKGGRSSLEVDLIID